MQASSSSAKEKAELAEKQAELDRALQGFRSGTLSAEAARQIIAQVGTPIADLHQSVVRLHTIKAPSAAYNKPGSSS